MPRRYSSGEIERALLRHGFRVARQSGSHIRIVGTLGERVCKVTLTAGDREIAPKTLGSIRAQLGLDRDAFERLIDDD